MMSTTTTTTTTITTTAANATVNGEKRKATLQPKGSRLLLLISSMSGNLEVKARQVRIEAIVNGLFLPEDQVEIIDGCDPAVKQRRSELFGLSGKIAQYPQLFLVTPAGDNKYVGDAQEVLALHDANLLGDFIGLVVLETKKAMVTLKTPSNVAPQKATTWVRQPSSRRIPITRRVSELVMTEYKGSEPHERAARFVQLVTRLWLSIRKWQTKVKSIRDDTTRIVAKIDRNTQKTKSNIQKQYDKDYKKVEKLENDIKRQRKKEKLLKHDIKVEKKLGDNYVKVQRKVEREKQRQEKYTEKHKQYKWRLEKEKKYLKTWDKDIECVQKENEKLLSSITSVSELLARRGVNWTQLRKTAKEEGDVADENRKVKDITTSDNNKQKGSTSNGGTTVVAGKTKKPIQDQPPVATITVPALAPAVQQQSQPNRLQTMMRRQSARQTKVSMVRQESQRLGNNKAKSNDDGDEAAPVYFVRLNSRAKLVLS